MPITKVKACLARTMEHVETISIPIRNHKKYLDSDLCTYLLVTKKICTKTTDKGYTSRDSIVAQVRLDQAKLVMAICTPPRMGIEINSITIYGKSTLINLPIQ